MVRSSSLGRPIIPVLVPSDTRVVGQGKVWLVGELWVNIATAKMYFATPLSRRVIIMCGVASLLGWREKKESEGS